MQRDGRFLEIGDDAGLSHLKDGAVTPYLVNEKITPFL